MKSDGSGLFGQIYIRFHCVWSFAVRLGRCMSHFTLLCWEKETVDFHRVLKDHVQS